MTSSPDTTTPDVCGTSDGDSIDAVTFYWRPGCGFCMGLERRLERLGIPLAKHNIWDDPEAAAVVRSIARGNETVPTVVVGEHRMVNPSADAVADAVRDAAPHLYRERARTGRPRG